MALAPQTGAGKAELFGTDGVRGRVGDFLTAELAFALGRAAAERCAAKRPRILIVRDTRSSGEMLESALAAGIAAAGGEALLAGVLPTPAASILVRRHGLDLGAVISASHNPAHDNGVKFFDDSGCKLSDESEARVESVVETLFERSGRTADVYPPGRVRPMLGASDDYVRELLSRFDMSLAGMNVLLDCAHGATYRVAPVVFERLGAGVDVFGCEPNGININDNCGSTHIDALAERMAGGGYDVGFAFDGDGDRVIAVDSGGSVVDGDGILAEIVLGLLARRRLGGGVVVTVMSNYGFHNAMRESGVEVATTAVGDRHVVQELEQRGWRIGGEQSGHIIDMDLAPSGDGIAAALALLEALAGRPLEAGVAMSALPQALVNVTVSDREALAASDAIWQAVDSEQSQLRGQGRVLVRPSGTEPVVRVMVEAPDQLQCEQIAARLAEMVAAELG